MNRLIFLICVFALSAFGCIYIPPTLTVDKCPEKFDSSPSDYLCDHEIKIPPQISMPAKTNEFDASGFSLVNWNIQKETQAGWKSDFERLSQNSDILIIQEALLTEELRRILNRKPYYWHLVTAFEIQQTKAGVLTAANIEPDFVCPLRAVEPLIRVPKTALITRYPLSNTHRSLMEVTSSDHNPLLVRFRINM